LFQRGKVYLCSSADDETAGVVTTLSQPCVLQVASSRNTNSRREKEREEEIWKTHMPLQSAMAKVGTRSYHMAKMISTTRPLLRLLVTSNMPVSPPLNPPESTISTQTMHENNPCGSSTAAVRQNQLAVFRRRRQQPHQCRLPGASGKRSHFVYAMPHNLPTITGIC